MQLTASMCVSHRPMPHRASVLGCFWFFAFWKGLWERELRLGDAGTAVTSDPSGGAVNVSFAGVLW